VQTLFFATYWFAYYAYAINRPFWYRGNFLLIGLYAFFLFIFTSLFGGNRLGFKRVSDVIYTNLLAIIFTNLVIYVQIGLIDRGFALISPMITLSFTQTLFIVLWSILSKYMYTKYFPPKKMLMVAGNINSTDLKDKMDFNIDSFDVAEVVNINEGMDHVLEMVKQYREVIISDVPSKERNDILKLCYHRSIRVFMTPKISDIIIRGAENIHLFDTPLLLSNNKGLKYEQRFLKRAFDLVTASVAIILLAVPFLIIALLIKLTDKGPVFYTQDRLTQGSKIFKIIKFRSMRVDSEVDNVSRLAQVKDPRITPIGKILRMTHVDELPQVFNILMGDMSVVGPRPERPDIAYDYECSIPEFAYRLKVKAGLTGYAQVYGKYNTTPYDKLKLDLFYIENYNFVKDINIILLTIKIMFQPEKSEGVAETQVTALQESNVKLK
jgi:exopolysaccharide biosynthesis polyprenyl glycosylphosphotransferase